jgi:hypothetical protein
MARQISINIVVWIAAIIAPFIGVLAQAATPLNDLGSGLYLDQFQGGLYPNGSNDMPAAHAAEGLLRSLAIEPRNITGQPATDGKYVLVSIGMSNTTQEFCSRTQGACQPWSFMGQAAAHPAVDHNEMVIVDGAQGGEPANSWVSPDAATYNTVAQRLAAANVSEAQVSAVWLKQANPGPTISLPSANADAHQLVAQLGAIVRAAKVRYPNLEMVFLSSRIFAGYATTNLNPEPYAYESGLAVKWLIEAQINQMNGGGIDLRAGDLDYGSGIAPWIAWGPYLWADGLNPRSDGLIWEQTDFSSSDGTHPAQSGREKVGTMLMDFMLNSAFTQPWFLNRPPGDYNNDGTVDAGDYIVWRKGLGTTYSQDHYNLWQGQFGMTAGSGWGIGSHGGMFVAEPASIISFAMATIFWNCAGLRRRGASHAK